MQLVLPYLAMKRAEAEEIIKFRELMAARYRRRTPYYTSGQRELQQQFYERVRELKKAID